MFIAKTDVSAINSLFNESSSKEKYVTACVIYLIGIILKMLGYLSEHRFSCEFIVAPGDFYDLVFQAKLFFFL